MGRVAAAIVGACALSIGAAAWLVGGEPSRPEASPQSTEAPATRAPSPEVAGALSKLSRVAAKAGDAKDGAENRAAAVEPTMEPPPDAAGAEALPLPEARTAFSATLERVRKAGRRKALGAATVDRLTIQANHAFAAYSAAIDATDVGQAKELEQAHAALEEALEGLPPGRGQGRYDRRKRLKEAHVRK